mmetsp:Transcript_123823/g.361536  ORF Transcript_123823/g.361536 Transcript_123823/m.361536 type:complete len:200 (+) Transcript_123823:93-692(+)
MAYSIALAIICAAVIEYTALSAAEPQGDSDKPSPRELAVDDHCQGGAQEGCAVSLRQLRIQMKTQSAEGEASAAESCQPKAQALCMGLSGESHSECVASEEVKCCTGAGIPAKQCCTLFVDWSAWGSMQECYPYRLPCQSSAEEKCKGLSGESYGDCTEYEKVKCCTDSGIQVKQCCLLFIDPVSWWNMQECYPFTQSR